MELASLPVSAQHVSLIESEAVVYPWRTVQSTVFGEADGEGLGPVAVSQGHTLP